MKVLIDQAFSAQLIAIARAAGEAILTIYHAPETANIQTKSDDSPLTAADLAAHNLIAFELPQLLDVPMLSDSKFGPNWGSLKPIGEKLWLPERFRQAA